MGFSVNRRNSLRSPACAGKSLRQACGSAPSKDHPRVCGEKYGGQSRLPETQGSPPRVRGKAAAQSKTLSRSRITPACAGKRLRPRRTALGSRNHPRVCGEKTNGITPFLYRLGSPPRVRGKVNLTIRRKSQVRITPACAGKSAYLVRYACPYEDHPRVCGEKYGGQSRLPETQGSPPRVRGKAGRLERLRRTARITPACAGKSASSAVTSISARDHPRVCGEKGFFYCICNLKNGITPACAGKS